MPEGEALGGDRLTVVGHADAGAFLRRAGGWLGRWEDEHNLILSLAALLAGAPPSPGPDGYFFATVEERGHVRGCVFRMPPYKMGVTRMPLAAAPLVARAAAQRYDTLPAVFGPREEARAVGRAWADLKALEARDGLPQRMYRLDQVVFPRGVNGQMRRGVADDLPCVHRWGAGFAEDAGEAFASTAEARARWILEGRLFLWEDEGEAVSMAMVAGRTARGARIGYVYTPRDRRGRGYASALVAALSQRQVDEGADFCVLYTDLTNPTSNAIYPRVGYRPLMDLMDVEWVERASRGPCPGDAGA